MLKSIFKLFLVITLSSFYCFKSDAQSLCDSMMISGSQSQIILTSNDWNTMGIFWETTAPNGTILAQDSCFISNCSHTVFNSNPSGTPYDTLLTCIYTMNTVCCITYFWNGSQWVIPGANPQPSWNCGINTLTCTDPGDGTGQYSSLSACQAACGNTTPCDSIDIVGSQSQLSMEVMPVGITPICSPIYMVTTDPNGYVLGEDSLSWVHYVYNISAPITDSITTCVYYTYGVDTLMCCVNFFWNGNNWVTSGSNPQPSWNCNQNNGGCYDPGDGSGQYSSLSACQAACSINPGPPSLPCDSMIVTGTQYQAIAQINNVNNSVIEYWETTAPDGTILGQDSCFNSNCDHYIYNGNPVTGGLYDTLITCASYFDFNIGSPITCCVIWTWDYSISSWVKMFMASATEIKEINFISIYPNPVKDKAILELNTIKNSNVNIIVSDISGRIVEKITTNLNLGNNKISIDTDKLENGHYLLNIYSENNFLKKIRFIKN